MTTVAARVLRVLTGHSPTALLHAVDADGHELRLEVPVAEARTVAPGHVLVVQWSAHSVPELQAPASTPLPGAAAGTEPATSTAPPVTTPASSSATTSQSASMQFEALLGLQPARPPVTER